MSTTVSEREIREQFQYMDAVRAMNDSLFSQTGRRRLAYAQSFGCQQNEADTERLRGMLDAMGYGEAPSPHGADLVIYNTCAVREHAEKRVLGIVGAVSHEKECHPDMLIALCGCMAEQEAMAERLKKSYPYVDLVFGPQSLWRFPELLHRRLSGSARVFDIGAADAVAEGLPVRRSERTRAWLSIMYGCNNFCSYCIVPYVRGRERSRSADAILGEARALVDGGCRDITLLGQNVNSYGHDLPGSIDFPELLYRLNDIPGDFLIRFMTSHPKDASARMLDAMAACGKVARHLHLPVQSGSDRILEKMNRRYTAEHYLSLVDYARHAMPDLVLTSDVIVCFPGETEADFEDTLALVRRVRYDALFTFLYSKRTGTPAARMPDSLPAAERQARFDRLLALQNAISAERHAGYVGRTVRVLVDGPSRDKDYPLSARTNGGRLVYLRGPEGLAGQFTDAVIEKSSTWSLFGTAADSKGGHS